MRNLFTGISILAVTSAFAEQVVVQEGGKLYKVEAHEFAQGDQRLCSKTEIGYALPARVNIKNGWDIVGSVSYIYWYTGEGGLDVATTAQFNNATALASPTLPKSHPVFQNTEYSSGFKLGLGGTHYCDDWIVRADYTRLHQETTLHRNTGNPGTGNGIGPGFYFTNWFFQTLEQGQGPTASEFTSNWQMNLDWVDLVVQRPYYSGRAVILTPFVGLRGSWIRQKFQIDTSSALNSTPPTAIVTSNNQSHSWGLGPRMGIDGRYLFAMGLRLQGELGGSLLFTQFTKVSHSESAFFVGGTGVAYEMRNFSCVRPMTEANLGLGWGGYFARQRYHLDVSATYDFNYLWSQNMMRVLGDLNVAGVNSAANDLYLHGLTLNAALNF